jgi:hypothetical protein
VPWNVLGAPAELPTTQLQVLEQAPIDEPAKELLGIKGFEGRHYLQGDEFNSHLWYRHIKGIGGAYMGIGSDQQYLFVGWARPEVGWLCDYDPLVVDLHGIYKVFFLAAETPEAFIKLWSSAEAKNSAALLETKLAGDAKLSRYLKLFREQRNNIAIRLGTVRRRMTETKTPSYLTDAETYGWVRGLLATGRLRAQSTNLLADKGIAGIARSARTLGVAMRTVYLSNAEQYWNYSPQFRANFAALPFDDKSFILRTLSTFSINKDYRYNLQPGLKFQAWLASGVQKVHKMVPRRPLKDENDIEFLLFDKDPPASKGKAK